MEGIQEGGFSTMARITLEQKEKEIKGYMKKLDLTYEEAAELWEDDHSDIDLPEVAEMTAKAKANFKAYVTTEKVKNKTIKRERKIDNDKLYLFDIIRAALADTVTNARLKNEVELNFNFKNENYTLKLTKHRNKK
jgi:hypothetical protein